MSSLVLLAQEATATIDLDLSALVALVAGVLILLFPKVLNYVIGVYLIAIALIEIFDVTI